MDVFSSRGYVLRGHSTVVEEEGRVDRGRGVDLNLGGTVGFTLVGRELPETC